MKRSGLRADVLPGFRCPLNVVHHIEGPYCAVNGDVIGTIKLDNIGVCEGSQRRELVSDDVVEEFLLCFDWARNLERTMDFLPGGVLL